MSRAVGYGLDFGTSNSSISIARDDGSVEMVEVGRLPMADSLPSIAYLHRDGNRLAGEDAVAEFLITGSRRTQCSRCSLVTRTRWESYTECRQYRAGGFCNDARLVYGLKTELANEMFRSTHSWANDFTMPDLVAIIIGDLKRRADRLTGEDVRRVVLGVPVAFVGSEGERFDELQALAEGRLEEAARAAGFDEVELLEEPAAAVVGRSLQPGVTVALDFGGGTFDVAVIDLPEGSANAEAIGLQGAAVGGTQFDAILFERLVAEQIDADHPALPAYIRRDVQTLMGIRTLLSDPALRDALASLRLRGGDSRALEELIYGGHAYDFYRSIEAVKFQLSESDDAEIEFARPGLRITGSVQRSDFEEWIRPHLTAVARAIEAALEEAGVQGDEVGEVVLTGGSCQIPAFRHLVTQLMANAQTTELPVYTAVAEGLGQYALGRWAA